VTKKAKAEAKAKEVLRGEELLRGQIPLESSWIPISLKGLHYNNPGCSPGTWKVPTALSPEGA
jgi:hypothetical protein